MNRLHIALICSLGVACVPDRLPQETPDPAEPRDGGVTVPDRPDAAPTLDAGTLEPAPDAASVAPDAGMTPRDAGFEDATPAPTGLPILGRGAHTIDAVTLVTVAEPSVGHDEPSDLAFHPSRRNELWVLNRGDSTVWIARDPGEPGQSAQWRGSRSLGRHFLPRPSGIAFGDNGLFATIHEEDRVTQSSTGPDFMGPTLWDGDPARFDGGHETHMDMLHNTPNGMGIAWETGNAYWVFDGYHSSLTRYDFRDDHGPGGTDHRDGNIARYVEGEVRRVQNVPSHLAFEPSTRSLFVADTGNNRVAILDVDSGSRGQSMGPLYDGAAQYRMTGASLTTFIAGADHGLQMPSGIELHDGHVFVGDNALGVIFAFSMDGELVDWLDVGVPSGGLMGLAFDDAGRLYFVDAVTGQVFRIEPTD